MAARHGPFYIICSWRILAKRTKICYSNFGKNKHRGCLMKKILLSLLTVLALSLFSASASADFIFPKGLTDIADEAFMDARVTNYLTIPEGVKTIGHRAFYGSRAMQVKLPASLSYIALDAFGPNASFEVLPGTYARQWCIDNGYFFDEMRVSIEPESIVSYPEKPAVLKASCSYPEKVDFYRWETSTDMMNWQVAEEQTGSSIVVYHSANLKNAYVRCRASVNGVLLEAANTTTVTYRPGAVKFDTAKSKALSGDAIYLEWTDMGGDMQYYLNQWVPDASLEKGGSWQVIVSKLSHNSYTLYGLEKDTEYSFAVVAIPAEDDGRGLRYESEEAMVIKTLNDPYSFKFTSCSVAGTSVFVEWEQVDGAYYAIDYLQEGRATQTIAETWTNTNLWLYGMPKDTDCAIRVSAWVPDKRYENNRYYIASITTNIKSGDYDPSIQLNEISVTDGGIAHLSWNTLGGCKYTVYMSTDNGDTWTVISPALTTPYYDVSGLERGKTYSFNVEADCASWKTYTGWVPVTIPERSAANAEYRALLIGEVSFRGSQYAERNYGDVELIADALAATKTPGGSCYSVVRRKDLGVDEIRDAIWDTFSTADENDVSLFFIGTHGDIDTMGHGAGSLSTVDASGRQDSLDLDVLAETLSRVKGKVIVWLGSCGSGAAIYERGVPENNYEALTAAAMQAFSAYDSVIEVPVYTSGDYESRDAETFETGEFRQEGKFYVLAAARYHEMSWGLEASRFNYFGKFIAEGITNKNGSMPADRNGDGKVTQNELFLYIKAREEDKANFIEQNVQTYPLNSDYVLFTS